MLIFDFSSQCNYGEWSCTKKACNAVCVAAGDPHYTTFDGFRFSYQGNCKYIMAQTTSQNFRVISENVPCGTSGNTCAKNIYIYYNSLSITLVRGRVIEVNGQMIENIEQGAQTFGDVTLKEVGGYYVVNSTEFMIKWDGATRLYIVIHPAWANLMEGVCGNYNNDVNDDLQ